MSDASYSAGYAAGRRSVLESIEEKGGNRAAEMVGSGGSVVDAGHGGGVAAAGAAVPLIAEAAARIALTPLGIARAAVRWAIEAIDRQGHPCPALDDLYASVDAFVDQAEQAMGRPY